MIMNCKHIIALIALTLLTFNTSAQDDEKGKSSISISTDGIDWDMKNKDCKESSFEVDFGGIDFGINSLQDKTDYNSAEAAAFLDVPAAMRNENLFNLRSGKSWNVNIWAVQTKWRMLNAEGQKIYLGSGVGLQMYNFRFTRPVTYVNETTPMVYTDSLNTITKNKLGLTYLSMPLNLVFKTRAGKDTWIVYGFGVTGGYRLSSFVKQVSNEQGKRKNHNQFNFNDFNTCLTAEVGIDDYFRLYASYQVTPLHENALLQYPLSIGIRFGGI